MTTELSVVKVLLCMLSLNLVILTPNTLYPYVHSVHNNRSLEPKFRVGSGAGVATRPAHFLGKNSRLDSLSSNFTENLVKWSIHWTTSTTAATVDTVVPRPVIHLPGNMTSLNYGVDSRQLLETPRYVETKLDHTTTMSSEHTNPQPFSALSHLSWNTSLIPALKFVGAGNITVFTTDDYARVHIRRLDTYEHGVHAKFIRRIEKVFKKWYRRDAIIYGGLGAIPCGALGCMFHGD